MPASVAVIVEWENALLSELDRAEQMLERLGRQAAAYGREHNTRFELLIVYNPEDIDVAVPQGAVERRIDPAQWPGEIRYVAAPGLHYYDQKNFGATQTGADLILFLDSDVIPEDGWLARLLDAADEPGTEVVGGQTFMAADTFLDRVFATFWFFEPKRERAGVYDGRGFYANNVAFRRDFFLSHGFPSADCYRGQCAELARQLRSEGVPMRRHGEAFVSHPAPDGWKHAFLRAVCHGYDSVYWMRRRGKGVLETSPAGGLLRFLRACGRVVRNVPSRARALRIDPGTALFAGLFGIAFSGVIYASEIVAFVAPGLIRRNVQI